LNCNSAAKAEIKRQKALREIKRQKAKGRHLFLFFLSNAEGKLFFSVLSPYLKKSSDLLPFAFCLLI
jgi:hypothetical protein